MAKKRESTAEQPVDEVVTTVTAVIPAPNEPAPVIPLHSDAGTLALALLDDEAFSERLEILKKGRDRIAIIQRELMEQDVDYGLIPGTPKPTLFKSGAEKLAQIYRLAARVEIEFTGGDGQTQPPLRYTAAAYLHLGTFDGPVVAVGHGTANSWEKRYRRESKKACPDCGQTAIIKSKAEYGGGWYCFPKQGGCGHKFAPDDARIAEQATDAKGDPIEANDLQNTLLKMAEKRAFVDAVLRATASSSLFTQDVVEEPEPQAPVQETQETAVVAGGTRVVDTSSGEVVEDRGAGDAEAVETRTASAEVQRGGHTEGANSAQIAQVQSFAKAMKMGPHAVADEIASVVQGGIDSTMLPDDRREAGQQVLAFLETMSSTDIGKLITHLRGMAEAKP